MMVAHGPRILHDPELRARLSRAGLERARQFSCKAMLAGLVREISTAASMA